MISEFFYTLGKLCGFMNNPKVIENLVARGVTEDEIKAAYEALKPICIAAYIDLTLGTT